MKKKSAAGAQSGTAVLERLEERISNTITPLSSEFRSIPLAAVAPSRALNTRAKITEESVKDLAESMKSQGLLQPIVVGEQHKDGSYPILAGRRRLRAAELLGWERINACVLDGGAARSLEVLVTENAQRLDPDPLLEAEAVARLLEQPGWSVRDVAAALGRSESWVARRSTLTRLDQRARAVVERQRKERPDAWPISWLEEIAMAPAAEQSTLIEDGRYGFDTLSDVRDAVRTCMGSLAAATWALDDATLVAKAGACTTCLKHSAASPGLFPEEPKLHVLKAALCTDSICFAAKRSAALERKLEEAKKEVGEKPMLVHGVRQYSDGYVEDEKVGQKAKVHQATEFVPAKKGDEGATPALVVDGPKAGSIVHVKKAPAGNQRALTGSSAPRPKSAGPVMSMAERRKAHNLRRMRYVFNEFRAQLEESTKGKGKLEDFLPDKNPDEVLLRLVAAYGTQHHRRWPTGQRGQASAGGAKAVRLRVLRDLVENMFQNGGCFDAYRANGDAAMFAFNDVGAFIGIIGWTGELAMPARVKAAEQALPEPKSWAAEKAAAKRTGKGAGARKEKKAAR